MGSGGTDKATKTSSNHMTQTLKLTNHKEATLVDFARTAVDPSGFCSKIYSSKIPKLVNGKESWPQF